jgi:hypothetical protein
MPIFSLNFDDLPVQFMDISDFETPSTQHSTSTLTSQTTVKRQSTYGSENDSPIPERTHNVLQLCRLFVLVNAHQNLSQPSTMWQSYSLKHYL